MSYLGNESFDDIVARKQAQLSSAANAKRTLFEDAVYSKQLAITPDRDYQGLQNKLNANDSTELSFKHNSLFNKNADADSIMGQNAKGEDVGIRALGLDTWEHSSYKGDKNKIRASQRKHYARLFNVPENEVTVDQIHAMGRRADNRFRNLLTEGQGEYDQSSGTFSNMPGKQFEGFEDQLWAPESFRDNAQYSGEVTYDPLSRKYKTDKRTKVDSFINPNTGVDLYKAMNTPEFNTRWFENTVEQNAIRSAYEAEHGTAYNTFKAPTASRDHEVMGYTQHGRAAFGLNGEVVSEKAITLQMDGKWVNVPTIWKGEKYSDDEVAQMLINNEVSPTSEHSTEQEAIDAAKKRSDEITVTPLPQVFKEKKSKFTNRFTAEELEVMFAKDSYWEVFAKSLSAGVDSVQAAGYGLAALAADLTKDAKWLRAIIPPFAIWTLIHEYTSDVDFADAMLEEFQTNIQEAQENGAQLPAWDAENMDWTNPDMVFRQILAGVGEFIPSIAGGGIGGKVVSMGVKGFLKHKMKKWGVDKAVKSKALLAGEITGAAIGSNAFYMGIGGGSVYGDLGSDGYRGRDAQLAAIGGGIVIGALDSIVPRSIAKQLGLSKSAVQRFKGELRKKGFVNSAGKVLTETAKGGLGEGLTETFQQVVENSVINMVKHGELPAFTSDEAFSEYVGVFIKSVLGGGVIKGTVTTGTEAVSLYKGDKGAIREAAEQIAAEAEDARNKESGEHSVEAEAELKILVKEFDALNLNISGLPEEFDSMNNLNKVIQISNALQKADNQEIINNSSRSTQEIESIQESLINVVNALQNSSGTNSVAAVEAAFDAAIKNDPARKDYYLQQKEQQLSTIKELNKLKKTKGKKKAISPALQKLIDDAVTVPVVVEKKSSDSTAKDSTDKDSTDKDATSEDDKVEQYSHEQRLVKLNEAFDAAVEANPKEEAYINKLRALEVANLEGQTILNQEIARINNTGNKGDTTGKGNSEFVGRLNKAVSSFKTGGVDSQLKTEQLGAALDAKGEKDKLNRKVEKTTDSNPSNREANETAVVGEKEKILEKEKEASKSAEETQKKADEKSTEVVSGHVEKIIKQINAISKKIEDSGINPRHKKRLEKKRNNLGLLIDNLASQQRTEKSVNEVTNIAIQDTLDSFDYQHVIVDVENLSITKSSDRDAIVKSALDAIEVLRDKDVEYDEKIRIIAGVLAARERLVQNLISIKKQLKRVTEEANVKDLETELNRTNDSIKKMEPFVKEISGMKFKQVNNTKNKYSDLLYSLKTESFKNIDRDALDDTDKPLYDLVAKMVAKQARRDKAVGNKSISQVNREILYGDEGYQGYEGYKQDAKDGTLSIKNLKNFVKGLQAKLVAFNKAVAKSKKLKKDVWVNKETLEIITERPLPEGQKTATLTKTGYKDFDRENFWFINAKNSNKLINLLKLEVELGVATLDALTKYKDSTKNKVVTTEEIEEHNKLIAQINKLVNPPEDIGDLNNLGKGETVKEALQPFMDAVNKATKKLNYESKQVVKYIKKLKANGKEVFETVYLKELKAKIALIEANINLWEAKEVVGKVTSTQASKAIIKLNSDIVSITAEIDKAVKDAQSRKKDSRTTVAKQHFLNAQERLKGSFIKIVSKVKDSIFVTDIFGVKDDTRLSLAVYAQDKDNGNLTAEIIKGGLIDLGITDKKYIRYIVKTFEQFKATYTDNIVADVDGKQSKKYDEVGVFNYSEPLGMLYVKDGKNVKLPDTVLFAMMMGSLEWLSISQGESAFMDSQAIAQYLKGDRKAHVTPEEISIFGNMGITYGNGSRSLGPIVYNYLNIRSLGANSKLKFSELMKDPTSIMKDSSIEERLIVALGEMSLEILEQMPATVTKAGTTNFISITHTEFPSEHFGVKPLVSWRETVKGISPRDIVKIPAVLRKAEKAVDTAFLKLSEEKQTWEKYISLWENYFNPTKGDRDFIKARKKELAVLRDDAKKRADAGLSNIFINETEDNLSLARVASSLINGYTSVNTIKLLPEDHKAFENIVKFIKEGKDNVKTTMGTQTILDDILDEPSTTVQERATGSPHLLPKFVRNLIEKLQNVEWRGKKGELGLFKLLNIINRRLLANMNDDINPHVEHVDGIEASNAIKEQELAAVDEYITLEGSEDGEYKSFYFRFKAQVQHRLRIVSNTINGQASKIHRALFLPIKAISTISLDTDKKQSISRIVFKIAVAQAFGFSVDKKPLTEILAAFDKYVEISKDLVEAVSRGNITEKEFNAKLTAFIKDNKDNDVAPSMHILEAIIALTEYDPNGVFDTRIGLEIDGITNGYAISLLQFLSLSEKELKSFKEIYGENTPEFKAAIVDELVSSLKRVGINVDKSETYDMFLQAGDLDVYQVLSMRIVESFNDPKYIEKINKDNRIKLKQEQLDALEGVQGTLFDKAKQKLEKLARDLAKAPVMTSVYGASIFKIINNIAADITDNVYTDFADFQRRYNATKEGSAEQSAILNEVTDYSNNLAALLNFKQVGVVKKAVKGERAKKQKATSIIKALKAGELEQHVLPRKTIETLEFTVVRIYTPAMTSTMDKLIGGLRESSSVVVKANEYEFMLFGRKLKQAKEYYLKVNDLPPESKVPQDVIEVLVKRLAMEYLPSYYGPKSSSTPIPLIKRGKKDDNAVTIKFKSKRVTKKKKLGKSTTRQDSKTPKIGSRATPGSSNTFERMGVGAALGQIINIDSAVLGEVLEVFPNALPIFDAYFGTVNDMVSVSKTYGSSFGRIGNTHSILDGTLKRLHKYVQDDSQTVTADDAIDIDAPYLKLTQEDIDKTNEEYAENSFEANELRKQLEKAQGNSNEEARIAVQLSELGISQIIGELNTRIDTVAAHKNLLKNAGYSLEDANVEQMPISSLKNKTQKPKTKTSSNDTNKNSDIPNIQGELPGFETAEGKPTKLSKTLKKSELQKLAKARDIDTSNMTVADLRTAIKRFDAGKKVFPKLVEPIKPKVTNNQPVTNYMKNVGIHPKSSEAATLRANDITSTTHIGLFKIPRTELQRMNQGADGIGVDDFMEDTGIIPEDDGSGNVDPDWIANQIVAEHKGIDATLGEDDQAAMDAYNRDSDHYQEELAQQQAELEAEEDAAANAQGDFIGDSTEYQYDSMFEGIEKDPSTYNIIKQKLKELYPEIKLKEVQTVIDGFGREVLGKALGSIIEVSSKGKLDTVPHEYAHVYINVLETTDFMDMLLKQVEKETGLDRTDAKEYLARHMGENFTKQIKKSKLSIKLGRLINIAKHKIISAMIALSYTLAIKVYGEEAGTNKIKAVVGAYYKRQREKVVPLKTNIKKASIRFYTGAHKDAIRFTPKTGYTKVSMEETLKNEPLAVTILGRVLDTFKTATLTGSIALAEQGDVFRHGISSLHDMDIRVNSEEFNNIEESVLEISPNAVLIYDIPTKAGYTIKSFIIPPDGRKIVNIKRDIRRVVSYKIIDVDTGKVVGVYKADVNSSKQIISEKTRGESAVILDLMESDKTADSINFFSAVMQRNIPLALAKTIFKAKQEIITGGMARDKDIIDYTLFAQDPITEVTDPELFVEKGETEETSTQQEDTTDSTILRSIAHEVTGKVKHIYTTHKLREKLQSVFDMLGEVTDDLMYMSKADKDTQVGHLARVMTDIISKAGHDLDRASVTVNEVTFRMDGHISPSTNAITVNVNTTSPLTYAGQSAQEVYVHELIHAVTRSALLGNSNFQHEIRKLRREVKATFELKARPYEVFLNTDEKGNVIYLTDKASEIADAKEQYNYVFKDGKKSAEPHAVLDEFLAYALTNKFLVKELSKMPPKQSPLWSDNPKDTPVEKIVKLLANLVNRLSTILDRKDRPKNIEEQIFALTYDVVAISEKRKSYLQAALTKLKIGEHFYRSNKIVSDFFKTIVKDGIEVGGKKYIAMVDKITKDGKVNSFIANLLYDTKLAAMYVAYGSFIDKHPRLQFHLGDKYRKFSPSIVKNMLSLKSDFFGNKDNVFTRLTFESNAKIDQTRKAYKNSIISNLLDNFKTEGLLTKENKEAITRGLFKTSFSDLVTLKAFSLQDAIAFFSDDKALATEITKYAGLLGMPSNRHYTTQTHALVDFMLTGNNDNINQFKNPELIYIKDPGRNSNDKVDQTVVDNLKIYVTLLAIQGTTDTTKKAIADIAKQEFAADTLDNGIINVVNMHTAFKHRSLVEGFDNTAAQMTQGYIATVVDSDISFEFAPTDKETVDKLRIDGFTLISKVKPIAGLQTTAYGIYIRKNDPDLPRVKGSLSVTANHSSGMSLMEIIRRDVKPVFVQEVFQNFMADQKKYMNSSNNENTMMPIIDAWGNITDYSIHMKHSMVEKHLNQNLQFDEVLATMYSNLEDKLASKDMNTRVITELHKYSKKHYKDNPKRFINILSGKNRDEYFNVLPAHTRYEITRRATYDKKTKSKQFFVDMTLLDQVFGYQLPSISTLSVFKKHPVAERRAKVFEKGVREVVAFVKETIIIRIPIVPTVNIISNYVSSFLHGVPIKYINKTWSEGVRELHMYQNDAESLRLIDLKILGNPTHSQVAQLERKRAKLVFRMNNSKVAKFMDMGLFNSITEDINQNEFTYRRKLQGKISNSKILNKFKGAPSEVINQLYMGEKTSTFKFFMHLTQISDFVARYTLYKYDTEVLKIDEETAYTNMVDMFVSYDRPLNKYLQYGNDHGFLLFIKYWIRIQRPALKLIKDKPVNVALLLLGNQMVSIESIFNTSVLTGNLFPMVGDIGMFTEEVFIPSGLEIMSGASL